MRVIHKNKLLEIIINNGYTIKDVIFTEHDDHCEINFLNTPFEFHFEYSNKDINSYIIGQTLYNNSFSMSWVSNEMPIENIFRIFNLWVEKTVKVYFEDQDEIDLWETMKKSDQFIDPKFIDFDDKSVFEQFEKEQITLAIDSFKSLIPERFSFSDGEIQIINKKLDYLITKIDTMNKFDWKSLLVSIIGGIAINMSVDKDSGLAFWELFKQMFTRIPHLIK
jgi:hypothetical protein